MSDSEPPEAPRRVTSGCTLPAGEQPLRLAEFDELLATAVLEVEPIDARRLRLHLRPEPAVAARVADLVTKEIGCCSFFTFTLTATSGTLTLEVAVPPEHVADLEVLTGRVAEGTCL